MNTSVNRRLVVLVFATSVFVSASLLFSIQPIVAKLLLPLLGGTPAVWNTCMLFFQTTLLLGYLYVLFVSRWSVRVQLALQMLILILAFVSLPVQLPASWANSVPATGNPSIWLLGCLLALIGLPFFIISTNGPLLQKWFFESGWASTVDPYVLYSVSNAGSLLALLLYPVLLERYLTLQLQTQLWSGFYVVLVLLVGGCAFVLWRARAIRREIATADAETVDAKPTNGHRLQWVALAFVPSTLMYGVTSYISTDIAAAPLIWVIPLALYLITLVIAFAQRQLIPLRFARPVLKLFTIGILLIYMPALFGRASFLILVHLLYFVLVALVFHTELANRKPAARYLADFYIWLSVGGALGGVFNSLIAPIVFRSIWEYPIGIALACLFLPEGANEQKSETRWLRLVLPASMFLLTVTLGLTVHRIAPVNRLFVAMLIPLAISYFLRRRSFGFGFDVAAVVAAAIVLMAASNRAIVANRNFFGVIRVVDDGNIRSFLHGVTDHGRQFTDPGRRCEPISYYSHEGPFGAILDSFNTRTEQTNVAMIGLGIGAAVAHSRPNQHWTFYEINPAVVDIARNRKYFTYLSDCAQGPVDIVVGDARLKLKEAPAANYDLIVLDAFSSDSIPVHLVTQQALDLYLAKLRPGGMIVFHISNHYLDLGPVVAELAGSRGLKAIDLEYLKSDEASKIRSRWIVMATDSPEFTSLAKLPDARTMDGYEKKGIWTDDYSNVLSAFNWRRRP
ncbi:MAG TPA: fused MFS/spermidine synthase [Pyrinomonadaceae bacterium]|nr:fused MFS/spermidine synthase [Pyrinomonadaceae bacterium]